MPIQTVIDLGQKVKAKYPGQYEDLSDEDLGKKVKAKYPTDYADFSDKTVVVKEHVRNRKNFGQVVQSIAENPTAGGTVGSLTGGPVGAALGGAGSQLIKEMGSVAPGQRPVDAAASEQHFNEAIQRVVGAGLGQGAIDAAGLGLARGAQAVGGGLMGAALRATPEVAQTAIGEGVMATRAGVKKLVNAGAQLSAKTFEAVRKATSKGIAFDPKAAIAGTEKLIGASFPNEDAQLIKELNEKFLANHPAAITPVGFHEIKIEMAKMARSLYRTIDGKKVLDSGRLTENKWAKQVAANTRQLLNDKIPDYAKLNGQSEALIELEKYLRPAAKKGIRPRLITAGVGTTIGAGAGAALSPQDRVRGAGIGAGAGALASSPAGLSGLALLASNPALAQILRYLPRAGAAGYEALGQ